MPNYIETIAALDGCYNQIRFLKEKLEENANSEIPAAFKDEIQGVYKRQIDEMERLKRTILEKLVVFPPHKERHFQGLIDFENEGTFDKSVFIMTKFPNTQNPQPKDAELFKIINCVSESVKANGFIPRIALGGKRYHQGLWDNVEMFLLGCKKGIAIVENKYNNELNPNVTMEWGWMRGMNRDVLFLVENTFDLERADISGLIQDRFEWENPELSINTSINSWLGGD
jgi:hypothetical protein